ncbi:universal stress protein [Bosea psychrotolerans]|uniref:Nucleotide-binding universal stress UspA family protein n=1 Tax=Bosea psychrotolerans TaxID=1871628 RepID=A0A2S4M5E6_9HYPH|nr:universal stress protein [Bosea psychrotolerans]POR49922.1 nucleotide-binding universal stress UspA family protein [Bosea psychrotolerans]
MIRDIVVVLDETGRRTVPFALALAKDLRAVISAVSVAAEGPFDAAAYSEVRYDLAVAEQESAIQAAQDSAARFKRDAAAAEVPLDEVVLCNPDGAGDDILYATVRRSDLTIIEQQEPGKPKPSDLYLEALLLKAGRPVLIVPYIGPSALRLDLVTVAWDGSVAAARALADSLPLLSMASKVEVVNVSSTADANDGKAIIRHLLRHGIEAEYRAFRSEIGIADTLLSHVADNGSGLLVMGAYGHSRLREAILGGVSRSILEAMTVPVLMSH